MLRDAIYKSESEPVTYESMDAVLKRHDTHASYHILRDMDRPLNDRILFDGKDACLILAAMKDQNRNYSHWVCLMRKGKQYEFFNSLGHSLEQTMRNSVAGGRMLLQWARANRVTSNSTKLQQSAVNVATCGYHVICRLLHMSKTHAEYSRWLSSGFMKPDLTVTMMCYLDFLRTK